MILIIGFIQEMAAVTKKNILILIATAKWMSGTWEFFFLGGGPALPVLLPLATISRILTSRALWTALIFSLCLAIGQNKKTGKTKNSPALIAKSFFIRS